MRLTAGITCLVLSAATLFAQATPSTTGRPTASISPSMAPFDGTWRMVATLQRLSDGTERPDPDLGSDPVGILMFDATTGQMCVVVNHGGRQK